VINGRAGALLVIAALIVGCTEPTVSDSSGSPSETTQTTAATTATTAGPEGPIVFHSGPLAAGRYVMSPFGGVDSVGVCMAEDPTCLDNPADDSIRVTLTVPDGFENVGQPTMIYSYPEREIGLIILRGAGLYTDPCNSTPPPDIVVGPTVDDFANAIAEHPLLDATTPVDVTLAGYSGKFIDLELPADIDQCLEGQFWPYEPGTYAHGPSQLWHLWILDVGGIRVLVQSMDYAHLSAERRAELQAIVDSITIEP
jgi:hypothetical protein